MSSVLFSVADPSARRRISGFLANRRIRSRELNLSAATAREASSARLLIVEYSAAEPAAKLGLIARFRLLNPGAAVIVCALRSSEDHAIAAFRLGVKDYFRWPSEECELLASIDRHLAAYLPPAGGSSFIGQSGKMRAATDSIRRAALTESNVLIVGETGTGKEVAARALHQLSARAMKPLVSVNCAAIPDTLLESELFGYQRGAFTGATLAAKGKLQMSHGGTIFFDEIGDMSAHGQAKLLRAVETHEVCPLGGSAEIRVDTRVIAATNQNLESMVRLGKFRADLLFRLNVIRIQLPPLRERAADVPALLDHFVRHFNERWGPRIEGFDEECRELLVKYDWPGNVRELKNVVEAVYVNAPAGIVTKGDLPPEIRALVQSAAIDERQQLTEALFAMNWNIRKVAEKLNLSRMTIYRKLSRYQISRG
jgi:DNA-binding NtrC family response regulator